MTVSELIQALHDCDKPDAEVLLTLKSGDGVYQSDGDLNDVYYESVTENTVILEGRYV